MKYKLIKDVHKPCVEDALWAEYDRDESIKNRNRLIEHYLYLLYKPVKSIYPICRNQNEASDIFQSGVLGLIDAVQTYSRDKNTSFKTFSKFRIHGAIIDYLRKSGLISLPYNVRRGLNEQRKANEALSRDFENPYHIASLDSITDEFSDAGFIKGLRTDISEQTEQIVEDKILIETVLEILKELPFDEYVTIVHYYFHNKTLEEIANKLKMTRSGIWQIRERALKNIRKKLGE